MIELKTISSEAYQLHTLLLANKEVGISLRYFPITQSWLMDVIYEGVSYKGIRLALGVLLLTGKNTPFDIVIRDNSNNGVDPILVDDFQKARCSFLILEADEAEQVRGYGVPKI